MLPVYKQQIESMIEVGSCGQASNCPLQTSGKEGGYDWSTLERAVPGYSLYDTAKEVVHYAQLLGSVLSWLLVIPVVWLVYRLKKPAQADSAAV